MKRIAIALGAGRLGHRNGREWHRGAKDSAVQPGGEAVKRL